MRKRFAALSIIEIILAIAIMAIIFTAGFSIFRLSLIAAQQAQNYRRAELLAMDLINLAISQRNENWNSLQPGTYHFVSDPVEGLMFAPDEEEIDGFTRWIVITEVQRNGSGQIVTSGGTVDEESMKVTAHVSWELLNREESISLAQYLTNWAQF